MGEDRARASEKAAAHPDESDIVAFASGELEPSEKATIDAHLDGCESCRGAVAALLVVEPDETLDAPTAMERTLPSPNGEPERHAGDLPRLARVGRYVVERVIGRGGMGVIYEAHDPQLGRRVALKVLRDALVSVSAERLQREAQALARVAHPNVVTVYDAGTSEDRVFLAMTLVEGGTLRGFLEAEDRTRPAVLEALLAAGRGLFAAHERGLVHRDFKPENVLVGEGPTFLVTDFGLVATADREGDRGGFTDLTRPGAILGTPAYMALEQLRGHRADPRADQFAFAVTLFEGLAGRRPFVGKNIPELAGAVMKTGVDWDAPSRFEIGALRPVIAKALSPKRDDRHASLAPVLAAIEAELGASTPSAGPRRGRLLERLKRTRRR